VAYFFFNTTLTMKSLQEEPKGHINMEDPEVVKKFCVYFNCSEAELIEATKKIGTSIEEVRLYLLSKGGAGNNLFRIFTE
jgi:hypothetical protein